MAVRRLKPVHPGEVLFEEFLKPMSLSQNRLAIDLGVPPRRINEIVMGKRAVTADTALRLARYFGNSARFWLGLQMDFYLDVAEDRIGQAVNHEVRLRRSISA
jgi:antitoxin HigA-1